METYVKLNHETGEITNLDEKQKNRLEKSRKAVRRLSPGHSLITNTQQK